MHVKSERKTDKQEDDTLSHLPPFSTISTLLYNRHRKLLRRRSMSFGPYSGSDVHSDYGDPYDDPHDNGSDYFFPAFEESTGFHAMNELEFRQWVLDHPKDVDTALFAAVRKDNVGLVEWLIDEKGASDQ